MVWFDTSPKRDFRTDWAALKLDLEINEESVAEFECRAIGSCVLARREQNSA